MRAVLAIFVCALACALTATPLARRVARLTGMLDQPATRKVHSNPMPLLGGVAIYLAVIVAIAFFGRHYIAELATILMAATVMALTGLLDDKSGLRASAKLTVQLLVAAGLYFAGVEVRLGWLPTPVNFILTVLWIVGITNAINLLDNMDGLSGGVCAVAAAFFTVIAAMHGQYMVSALGAAVLGACVGFLFFNARPASIFMGDTGSLFLGLVLACIGIKLRFPDNSSFVTWMVPVLVLWVPLFDTTLVTVSRLRRGVNPLTTPGRDHVSHRLVNLGRSHLEAVLTIYVAGAACGLVAMLVMQSNVAEGYFVGLSVLAVSAWLFWRCERASHG